MDKKEKFEKSSGNVFADLGGRVVFGGLVNGKKAGLLDNLACVKTVAAAQETG